MSSKHDKFLDKFRALVKGWRITDVHQASTNERAGLCELVLENYRGDMRRLTICATDCGAWIEGAIDQNHIHLSLEDMIDKIERYVEKNEDDIHELEELYGDEECLPLVKFGTIVPLLDLRRMQWGFRFEKDGTEWWTNHEVVQKSQHPFRRFFQSETGRKKLADLLCRCVLDPERGRMARDSGLE